MAKVTQEPTRVLHIVSDATGHLAAHMVRSVLTQFPEACFRMKFYMFVREGEKLREHLEEVEGEGHLVLHRLLRPDLREQLRGMCRERGVPEFDLIGGLVDFLAAQTHLEPANDPERLHQPDEEYFQRIHAMEFTAQHDDNRRLESINEADIVLVGLSRVSKSPTSTWLGALGYKVANVAVSRETGFPGELEGVGDRTAALTTRPKELWEIRRRRFQGFHDEISEKELEQLPYYDLRSIIREVVWSEREYRKRKIPMIDITGQTVEEVASRVISTLKSSKTGMMPPETHEVP